jgi:hypothetical protein
MSVASPDLWSLTQGRPQIDPEALACAVEREVAHDNLDYRTRLLIRDSLDALAHFWGRERLDAWLTRSSRRATLEQIWQSEFERPGFPTLHQRLMDTTKPGTIHQFLRELGAHVAQSTRLQIGGSGALILAGSLSRRTDDLDVVDEVPPEIRAQHDLLNDLAARYGLRLAHFQSHYLPDGWASRLKPMGQFGRLEVFVIDPCDIFVGKLFSARTKDRDDLRVLATQFDKGQVADRVRSSATALLREPELAQNARRNWYIVFGEELPS